MRKILGFGIVLIFLGVAVWAQSPSGKFNNMTLEGDLTSDGNSSIHGFNIPLYYTDNVTVKEALDQLFAQGEGGWLIAGWDNTGTLNINNFPTDMRPVQIVNTVSDPVNCGSATYPTGSVVFLSTDYKLWRCGSDNNWTKAIDNTDIEGVITAGVVNAGTVIADNVITNNMLVGSISAAKLTVDHLTAENTQSGTFQQSYTAPGDDNTTPGSGMKITGGKIEAYGSTHTFGGSLVINDGDYLLSVGQRLKTLGYNKRYPLNNATNFDVDSRLNMYKWTGAQWVNILALGSNTASANTYISQHTTGPIGLYITDTTGDSSGTYGIFGQVSGTGMQMISTTGTGIEGLGLQYGGNFRRYGSDESWEGPIKLEAAAGGAPTHSSYMGTLWVDSDGILYINTGTNNWSKVGAQ